MGRRAVLLVALGATACGPRAAAQGDAKRQALVARIDSIVTAQVTAGKAAGASIAVVQGQDVIRERGYGKANLELAVPTPAHATYEIGSVTKQFTAAAIMQLVEQGKINLDADLHTYLPTYNSQGRKITVRRLLDHTSGIMGYTEMKEFGGLAATKLPRDTLVTLFSKQPFTFEPGEEESYNNSAFFLLGLIIEKVSGMPYAAYVQKNLFDRAGMADSYYCSETVVHPNHVTGYSADSAGFTQKEPLSHQWPFSAGSLCSSAVDLAAWNDALHRRLAILGKAAHDEMMTPGTLNDGTTLGYAKGIAVYPRLGHRTWHHGGGINGFLSENLYFPDDSLSVIVLYNSTREGPDATALAIAKAVLGEPKDPAVPIDGDVQRFVGKYAGSGRGGRQMQLEVTAANNRVLATVPALGDSLKPLVYVGHETFLSDEARLIFSGTPASSAKVRIDTGYGNNLLHRR
jgi:CubicO group peptidase (beta-lactamase class C family)